MISFPNAKINIGLNVVSKRTDGYHNLETIFYPLHLSDALEIVKSEQTTLSTSGLKMDGDPTNNLVFKAYQILKNKYNLPPLKIHLHKVIPFGAGLGGGSSDAAYCLKMLDEYFNLKLTTILLEDYAAQIGADCPFFIQNNPTFASGTGNQFQTIKLDLSGYKILVAKPDISVSTPEAFRNIQPKKPQFDLREIDKLPIKDWRNTIVNDFEKSVFPLYPQIKKLKEDLYSLGAIYASMSGSGSAVFGIFRHLPADSDLLFPNSTFTYR